MKDEQFPDLSTKCYLERLASAKAFWAQELHSHSFFHEGKHINAYPEPEVFIKPLTKGKKKYHVDVTCPICNITLPETTKAIYDLVEAYDKIRGEDEQG